MSKNLKNNYNINCIREQILSKIKQLYYKFDKSNDIDESTKLYGNDENKIHLSSLNLMQLLIQIEKEFDITVSEYQKSISDIIELIEKKDKQ